jgi:hypothetical protein
MKITGRKTPSVFRYYDLGDTEALPSVGGAERECAACEGTRQISEGQGVIDAARLWSRFGVTLAEPTRVELNPRPPSLRP